MKRALFILFAGFVLGTAFSGLVTPSIISWYFDPPTSIGVSCKEAVEWGIVAYQKLLISGGVVGLLMALVLVISNTFKSKPENNTGSPPNVQA